MNKPEIILCDIDGTIADCSHRLHYISNEINVGDTVRPVDIENAKQYRGTVDFINPIGPFCNSIGVIWRYPHSPNNKQSEVYYDVFENLKKVKSWHKFFEAAKDDTPIETTCDIIRTLAAAYPIVFVSGRPETYRQLTGDWLCANNLHWVSGSRVPILQMRPENDRREDYKVKEEIYRQHIEPGFNVKCVFDDRQQCVDMWRNTLGLQCYQVCKGDY